MSHDPQHEIWNPFCERVDGLSAKQRADVERAEAWAYYARRRRRPQLFRPPGLAEDAGAVPLAAKPRPPLTTAGRRGQDRHAGTDAEDKRSQVEADSRLLPIKP